MEIIGFIVSLLVGVYIVVVVEGWANTGTLRLAAPILGAIALLGQESPLPRKADRWLFEVAPLLLLVASVLVLAVIPLAPGLIVTDLATGALFINAALAYVMVALVMSGWGPNGVYAMVGGWRFLAQLVAYSMLIVMPLAAVAMRAQSLFTSVIVSSQASLWNALAQPLGFVLFVLAAMEVSFLPPFDLPDAPGELAGGVAGEYTGVRLAVFRLGRLVLVLALASAITTFYLGGSQGPLLPGPIWTALKIVAVICLMLAGGRFLPRLREETLMEWSWKLGVPLALVNIFWVGVTLLLVKG
ncbi:MAG: NADH-quinone oxidoreductase subunit H [Chloroflexi bacterium]|nr:NADH-quinone oxidoreductase subunit H [Chloroflexota bacterium]OJV91771.1 MAG: NADH dehydrogenase [Chloroflexi bacterium 54-19]